MAWKSHITWSNGDSVPAPKILEDVNVRKSKVFPPPQNRLQKHIYFNIVVKLKGQSNEMFYLQFFSFKIQACLDHWVTGLNIFDFG